MRQTVQQSAAARGAPAGRNAFLFHFGRTLQAISRQSGPRCFACEKQRADFEEGGVGARQRPPSTGK